MKTNLNTCVEAYRTTFLAAIMVCAAQSAYTWLDGSTLGLSYGYKNLSHVVLATCIVLWLLYRKNNIPREKTLDYVFIILSLPFLFLIWETEMVSLQLGQLRNPMVSFQMLALYIAMFAPSSFVFAIAELVVTLLVAMVFFMQLPKNYVVHGLEAEPWATILAYAVAFMLLLGRKYRRNLIIRLAKTEAEAQAFERSSRLFSVVRDRANSPLQVLELNMSLLEKKHQDQHSQIEQMRRAVTRLNELSNILAETDLWKQSFDRGEDMEPVITKTFERLEKT